MKTKLQIIKSLYIKEFIKKDISTFYDYCGFITERRLLYRQLLCQQLKKS